MKKHLFITAAVVTVFTALFSFVSADASADYTESSEVLTTLGVFDSQPNTEELESGVVSRIDALKMMLSVLGQKNASYNGEVIFSDVPANSGYFPAVSAAAKLGIVKSTDFLNFSPTSPITTDEFSRMLVRTAGYEFKAAKYNYSLSGYTRLAMELDMLDRCDISDDGYISLGQASNTVYNMLLISPVVEYAANGSVETYVDDGNTILEKNFGCKSVEGIYFENAYTSLYGGSGLAENEFAVSATDNSKYVFRAESNYHDFLGYNVKVFYKQDGAVNNAVCLVKKKNKTLVINGDDFKYYDADDRTIHYTVDVSEDTLSEKTQNKTVKLSNLDMDFIYNGQVAADSMQIINLLNACGPESGTDVESVTLVDNDGDSKYEIISVNIYRDVYVDYVNSENKSFADSWGHSYKYDENSGDYYVLRTDDGRKSSFNAIKAGCIIRIKEGLSDDKLYDFTITSNEILARISSKIVENGRTTVEVVMGEASPRGGGYQGSFVGGSDNELPMNRYKIATSFEKYFSEVNSNTTSFYRFFLNKDGEIAGYDIFIYDKASAFYPNQVPMGLNTYNAANIGVVLAVDKDGGLKEKVRFKLFDKPLELRTYNDRDYETTDDFKIKRIKESCLYDGSADDAAKNGKTEVYNKLASEYEQYGDDGSKYSDDVLRYMFGRKFITYGLTDDMVIYEITLPGYYLEEGQLSYYNKPGAYYYRDFNGTYSLSDGNQVILPSYTVNIIVPDPDCSYANKYDLCQCVLEFSALQAEQIYKMDFYTFNKDSTAAQFSVRYIDYDSISTKMQNAAGIVVNKTQSDSPYGFIEDNYYIKSGDGTYENWGAKRVFSVYPKTYAIPEVETGVVYDKLDAVPKLNYNTDLNFTSAYYRYKPLSELNTLNIEPGDIAAFYYPNNIMPARGAERFMAARLIYDRSERKFCPTINSNLTNLKEAKYVLGKIYDVNDDAVAFMPSYFIDAAEQGLEGHKLSLQDCTILLKEKVVIVMCEEGRDGRYDADYGDWADLYSAMVNNYDIVANIYAGSTSKTAQSSYFYIYKE